jgi:peptidoglycan/xylan/chitin deacetylase (PgdA/CDA1 family)
MLNLIRLFYLTFFTITVLFSSPLHADNSIKVPILCYHNLNPTVPGSMNMTPEKFESQIKWLKDNGYTFITLKDAVAYLKGERSTLPAKPVVITADDGWQSDYTYLYPIAKKYNIPVTLFIYPGTISEGKHALTWNELKELQQTGLFDIQGHTYSHPNFKVEKRHLSEAAYDKFVTHELAGSKKVLEDKLGIKVELLAWPFGIYDDYLEKQAANAGYVMAFSIDDRKADRKDKTMAQPRFMLLQLQTMKTFVGKVS